VQVGLQLSCAHFEYPQQQNDRSLLRVARSARYVSTGPANLKDCGKCITKGVPAINPYPAPTLKCSEAPRRP
jgi:hypothetical protein